MSNRISKCYLERIDQEGRVQTLLTDSTANLTATPSGHYVIANKAGQVFFMGNSGIKGVQHNLQRLPLSNVLVNGVDFEAYRLANNSVQLTEVLISSR